MYNENYLILADVMELEEAGLDVDELADMSWDDRYDAIDEAGLNPLDYEYGFLDDDEDAAPAPKPKKVVPESRPVSVIGNSNRRRGLTRQEKKAIKKARKSFADLEATLDALMGMRL